MLYKGEMHIANLCSRTPQKTAHEQTIAMTEGQAALLERAGLVGLEGSCSPSWTGSRGEDVGLKRGKMEGKVMRRRGECLLPVCLDNDPALAIPTYKTGMTTSWAQVWYAI